MTFLLQWEMILEDYQMRLTPFLNQCLVEPTNVDIPTQTGFKKNNKSHFHFLNYNGMELDLN